MMLRSLYAPAALLLSLATLAAADDVLAGVKPFAADQPWPVEPPKMIASPTNAVMRPKVLVVNFAPRVPSQGNRPLWEVFNWHNPRELAAGFIRDLSYISGGAVVPQIVEWRDVEEFPVFTDGFRYTGDEYAEMRPKGADAPWHAGQSDFYAIARQHEFAKLVNDGTIDEVWMFGDHYFYLLGEDWMAGPGAFFINGPSFPDFPVDRAFAGFGFSYERHTAEMIHNLGHRTENHMKRAYGGWNRKQPATLWDRFAAASGEVGGEGPFGVGFCHFPPNGRRDYDYTNPAVVQSTAADWLNFPKLTGVAGPVSVETWAVPGTKRGPVDVGVGKGFEHLQYQRWFFSHLPRADGVNDDGRQNNWFKYIFDFNTYAPDTGAPRENEAFLSASDTVHQQTNPREVRLRIYNTNGIDASTIRDDDVELTSADGTRIPLKLASRGEDVTRTAGFARTIRYESDNDLAPGTYKARLPEGRIRDRKGGAVGEANVTFTIPLPGLTRLPINAMVSEGLAEVTGSPVDLGGFGAVFDDSDDTFLRTKETNPATVQLVLKQPATITGIRFRGSHAEGPEAYRWSVESADSPEDLAAKAGTYRELVRPLTVADDVDSIATLEQPVTARVFKLTAQRLVGDNWVHLNVWDLLIAPQAPAEPPTAKLIAFASAERGIATFDVVYTGSTLIDRRSIGNDIHILGPGDIDLRTSVLRVERGEKPEAIRVTYSVPTPVDRAGYRIVLDEGQVYDVAGVANKRAELGTLPAN